VILVADASVALKWFVEEDGSAAAAELIDDANIVLAPDLIIAEVCNAAWKSVRRGNMRAEQFARAAVILPTMFDELVPLSSLCEAACAIASKLDHPVYDTFYLALADLRQTLLVTADRRLLARMQGTDWQHLVRGLDR
jgi:predicted nucleic acid-binding protein